MKKLDQLNLELGFISTPSPAEARSQRYTLYVTVLSLDNMDTLDPLDPASLPLVRSLYFGNQPCTSTRLLLPQLASQCIGFVRSPADFGILISNSISITSLTLNEHDIPNDDESDFGRFYVNSERQSLSRSRAAASTRRVDRRVDTI
jgi:hypothetical protein